MLESGFDLAWYDFLTTYRRSALGALWLPLQTAAFVSVITIVLGRTFENETGLYAVYVTLGYIVWDFLSGAMTDGPKLFAQNATIIKNVPTNLTLLILRKLFFLLFRLAANAPVAIGVLVLFGKVSVLPAILALFSILLFMALAYQILTIFGFLGAYFRDFPFLVQTVVRFLFFMTPIVWYGDSGMRSVIAKLNPFTYFIETFRAPLMGELPSQNSVLVVALILATGGILSYLVHSRMSRTITFWL